MPQAVTHLIISLVLMSIIRDFYVRGKSKKSFPLHYVLIAGVAGLLPDIDIAAFWVLNSFGFVIGEVHRTFTHTLFVPLLFFVLFLAFGNVHLVSLGKHKLKLGMVFLMIAFGSLIHLLLDGTLAGSITPFYPFLSLSFGFDLINYLPAALQGLAMPSLDALILVLWLVYIEMKHKISDFI